jgi:cytidylate kinase
LRKGGRLTLEETLAEINERDRRDSERAIRHSYGQTTLCIWTRLGKRLEEVLQDIVTLVETRQKEDAAKDE